MIVKLAIDWRGFCAHCGYKAKAPAGFPTGVSEQRRGVFGFGSAPSGPRRPEAAGSAGPELKCLWHFSMSGVSRQLDRLWPTNGMVRRFSFAATEPCVLN